MSEARAQLSQEGSQEDLKEDAEDLLFTHELQCFENMTLDDNLSPINDTRDVTPETASTTETEISGEISARLEVSKLPVEMWLLIFDFLGPGRVCIWRVKERNLRGETRYKLGHTELDPRDSKGQVCEGEKMGFLVRHSMNGMLCCRQFYKCISLSLYEHTQFVFKSTKALRRFLDTTSPEAQGRIRHMELFHEMQNNPLIDLEEYSNPETIRSQLRSDYSWRALCKRMLNACPNLRYLYHETLLSDRGADYLEIEEVNPGMFLSAGATAHVRRVDGILWVKHPPLPLMCPEKLLDGLLGTTGRTMMEYHSNLQGDLVSFIWTTPSEHKRTFIITAEGVRLIGTSFVIRRPTIGF